jgi:hypothetical protein
MKMTNAQMFDAAQTLAAAKDEKGLLGYAIAVNLRRLNTEVREYAAKRDELLAAHGSDAGNGRYNLTQEGAAAFYAELQPFAELETDVQIMQVAPEVFYGGNLTSGQMYALDWMAKEE